MKKPAKNTSPDWTEMYRLELGINPSDRHQLLTAVGSVANVDFGGKNSTLGYQPCDDLQTPKLPKKHMCDRTLVVIDVVLPCADPLPRRARCERRRWG
jgi:hypothetical protein